VQSQEGLAIVFSAPGRVELRPIRVPELQPEEILVRTEMTGISAGTDRSFLQGRYRGAMERFPLVYGYQRVGTVEAVGAAVSQEQVAVGDRVFAGLAPCRLDSSDGLGETGGAYTSLAVAHYSDVHVIPSSVRLGLEELALGGMAAIGLHAVEISRVTAGELVVVVGQGMIGQFDAQLSHLRGARVVVSDLIDRRLELAWALG
jgi:L-iditol 2-dehydrogenase